jgi:large subunit ribosomal protein L53
MITKFITEVSTVFNPFSPKAKTARLFLSFFPGSARQTIKIQTKMLPRTSKEKSYVTLKFSTYPKMDQGRYSPRDYDVLVGIDC